MEKYLATDEQLRLDRATKRVKAISGFYKHLSVYIIINLFLITLKWFRLDPGEPFFRFSNFLTAFFWGFGVVCHAASVFGRNVFLGPDWEERKIRELMDKGKSDKWV